jgi:hypothetical protein
LKRHDNKRDTTPRGESPVIWQSAFCRHERAELAPMRRPCPALRTDLAPEASRVAVRRLMAIKVAKRTHRFER